MDFFHLVWEIVPYLVVHKPLAVSEYDFAELMEETESEVVKGIKF
jgi:hypothetical protein